jgi:hypothetical protein
MKTIYASTLFILLFIVGSCGETSEAESDSTTNGGNEKCTYTYNSGSTNLKWTSYKYTSREPVAGTFNSIKVESSPGNSVKEVVESIEFSIATESVETENVDRNGKIAKLFFAFMSTPIISGNISSLSDDGKAKVNISMNNMTREIEGNYSIDGTAFTFEAEIDVVNWEGGAAIQSLNDACKELHDGGDGVSKLWSEVSLLLEMDLLSECE